MIFDRVRVQYPAAVTVRFAAPRAASILPSSTPSLPTNHRLASTFRVTTSDKLGGSKEEVLRAIRAARANMRARVHEPFELVFDEADDAASLLASNDVILNADAHRRKVRAFERRTLIAARQARWTKGVELILWFGGTLFRSDQEVIEEACRIAISNWFAVAATNIVNPGGMFEAAHEEFYRSHGLSLSFPG